MNHKKEIFLSEDDGLFIPEIGSWGESKYQIIYDYNVLFSSGMRHNWDNRIYIDLYSGSGKARVRSTKKILNSSALLALKVPDPYDKYIFCDIDEINIASLEARVQKDFPTSNVRYIIGDCNKKIEPIINEIPKYSSKNTVLTFCLIDPFSLDIKFDTIRKLGESRLVDFLILFAFGMDGKRNINLYLQENNSRIDNFLGLSDWRERWKIQEKKGINLVTFLANEFTKKMVSLNYRKETINNYISIRSDEKNLPLYHLMFFSKHPRGYDFWEKVRKRNIEPELEF
ncbi:MAG: three-Cys-motif partner protein TcmP [Ignavibacteriaceae bacterium]